MRNGGEDGRVEGERRRRRDTYRLPLWMTFWTLCRQQQRLETSGDKMRDFIEDNIGPDLATINFSSNWRNRVNIIVTSLSPIKQKWRLKFGMSGQEQWRLVRRILTSSLGYQGNIESLNSAIEYDLNLVTYSFYYMSGCLSLFRSTSFINTLAWASHAYFIRLIFFFKKSKSFFAVH